MKKGILYLIPTYLDESNDKSFLAPMVLDVVTNTKFFLVENVRTARRFISSLNLGLGISSLTFNLLDKNSKESELRELIAPLLEGQNMGVLSEAGLPGLADPGNLAVRIAHQLDIRVIPLPGASAIQTALIASGFNGQQFTFHGYIPIDKTARKIFIKKMEELASKTGYTQIFMETPFRNQSLIEDLKEHCFPETKLSISAGLFSDKELIMTGPILNWKSTKLNIHKIPAVFCIGNFG